MPMLVKIPNNKEFINKNKSYRAFLNCLDRKQTAVQRQLRRSGLSGYEPHTQAALFALCEIFKNFSYVDVGAHIGIYPSLINIIFEKFKPSIFAIEASPETYRLACDLRLKNNLNYRIFNFAFVSELPSDGVVDLYLSPKAETSNSLNSQFRGGSHPISVKATTLDEWSLKHFNIYSSSAKVILKMDVETFEIYVMQGGINFIHNYRPAIISEILNADNKSDWLNQLNFLQRHGYYFYCLDDNLGHPFSSEDVLKNISESSRDWLFYPDALTSDVRDSYRIWLKSIKGCKSDSNIFIDAGLDFRLENLHF